jgi:hypothetical protein
MKPRRNVSPLSSLVLVCGLATWALTRDSAQAADVFFNTTPSGDWSVGANWIGGVPTASDTAWIGNVGPGTAIVSQVGMVAGQVIISWNLSAGLDIQNGSLSADQVFVAHNGFSGSVNHSGGTLSYNAAVIGAHAASPGTYTFSGGTMSGNTMSVGYYLGATVGSLTQSSGSHSVANYLSLADGPGSVGTYQLSGGSLSPVRTFLGANGQGILNQSGGTYHSAIFSAGQNASGVGTFNLTGGTFTMPKETGFNREMIVGDAGSGTWNIGNASATGTIGESGAGPDGVHLKVRNSSGASGTVRGWGTVGFTAQLVNNGRIVADGYGTDRTLSLTGFSSVDNTIENTGNNGWFALNGGKLTLPTLSISPGSSTKLWGESAGDPTPDLVNSVKLQLNSIASGGNLAVSLLAPNRADVPASPDGRAYLGIWDFAASGGLSFGGGDADLTFRFDSTSDQGADLKLWHYDGSWTLLSSSFNDTDHTISTTGINSFSLFAITVPEPSALALVLGAALVLARRRQRG